MTALNVEIAASSGLDRAIEALLVSGGDERITPIPALGGRSRYGVLPRPEPGLSSWSSCTASSPTALGFKLAQRLLARLGDPRGPDARRRWAAHAARQRDMLAMLWGRDDGQGIVWAASATDAELLVPLICAASRGHRRIANIVVGPAEVGRGIVHGAGGRAPFSSGPLYGEFTPGACLQGLEVRVCSVLATLAQAEAELDQQILAQVAEARRRGEHCVLHLVHGTKLGRVIPRIELCEALAAEGVDVVVDAAQGRLSPAELGGYLDRGWLVIGSASKFFAAPPFCGFVWIPSDRLMALREREVELPLGFGAYFSRADLSADWGAAAASLPHVCNPGLIARWELGLAEMTAYFAVDAGQRQRWMAAYNHALAAALTGIRGRAGVVELDACHGGRGIHGFVIRDLDGQPWSKARLDQLHARLLKMAGQRLGQVVSVAGEAHRLRVAVAAADVVSAARVAARHGEGAALAEIERRCAGLRRALVQALIG